MLDGLRGRGGVRGGDQQAVQHLCGRCGSRGVQAHVGECLGQSGGGVEPSAVEAAAAQLRPPFLEAGHLDVAKNPDQPPVLQDNGNWKVNGTRNGVQIEVIVAPDGSVVTGYPIGGEG